MLAIRHGERALPLLCQVEATEGAIGFAVQKTLLDDAEVCLMADRFYAAADLIAWCQDHNWDYCLRLKGNLVVSDAGGWTTTGRLAKDRVFALEDVQLTARLILNALQLPPLWSCQTDGC
ncbi:hypothetical protein [Azospirillum griseum]|uniref:Transposase IS4-like domain-containing protein n=1 Tax=Azospirillum griseum TaxID=2496639 RepID=A0A3S0JER8_9PROT|nr:hypothetical protein [Azospirillum griseum]RTR15681.1 hypothetical protein EJ903_22610 [Azospirillum griseum]